MASPGTVKIGDPDGFRGWRPSRFRKGEKARERGGDEERHGGSGRGKRLENEEEIKSVPIEACPDCQGGNETKD